MELPASELTYCKVLHVFRDESIAEQFLYNHVTRRPVDWLPVVGHVDDDDFRWIVGEEISDARQDISKFDSAHLFRIGPDLVLKGHDLHVQESNSSQQLAVNVDLNHWADRKTC